MSHNKSIQLLSERLSSISEVGGMSSHIIKFAEKILTLNKNPSSISLTIPLSNKIADELNILISTQDIIKALCHPDVDFLEIQFILITDDDDLIEISISQALKAMSDGYIQHPKNPDEIIHNCNDCIGVTFVITDEFAELIRSQE